MFPYHDPWLLKKTRPEKQKVRVTDWDIMPEIVRTVLILSENLSKHDPGRIKK